MSNISDLDDFKSTETLKKEILALTRENKAAMLTIDKLLKSMSQQTEKITHLESLISQAVPVMKKETKKLSIAVSAEEEVAAVQLERLRQSSQARSLTLEEVRMYDLLVKNKRLALDESTINLGKNQYRDVTNDELLQLAATEVKPNGDPDAD